ncbi:hypothetical protein BSPWISOX_1109 [uncultured Gammaproteobacteria bacterium]|nr:hypothetical protein BSPCLSOX_1085 [uncultured Gammaproteobacteria bacterium]VVH62402.1 hypothetical protein BSPWISOX_1109 [uncultured Gammaproteobacteria bacterium]
MAVCYLFSQDYFRSLIQVLSVTFTLKKKQDIVGIINQQKVALRI